MPFDRIVTPKGSDIVKEHILRQIRSGLYPPGSRLPTVVNLAADFEVGRSTVREALSALKAMGWVDIRHGGGTFVSRQLPDEETADKGNLFHEAESLMEVLEVRKFIETGSAALAAKRRTDEDLRELTDILHQMEAAVGDERTSQQADVRFHLRIAHASGNSLMVQMMESMTRRLEESMKETRRLWFFNERATAQLLLLEHKSIFEAIRDKDEQSAGDRMARHIAKVDAQLRHLLRNADPTNTASANKVIAGNDAK